MRAISLHQPWASMIALGRKGFETRSWSTRFVGRLAIHAAKRKWRPYTDTPHLAKLTQELWGERYLQELSALPYGCIVAVCDLVRCVPAEHVSGCSKFPGRFVIGKHELSLGNYKPGRWAWQLENVMRLKMPIAVQGRQRFFDVEIPLDTEMEMVEYQ